MDDTDQQIEKGSVDPPEEGLFYPKGVLNILALIHKHKKYQRPRGKESPTFSDEEIEALAAFLFFRSSNVELKVRKQLRKHELLKSQMISAKT